MARLYADEDFDYPAVEALRLLGHDVLTVQEAGRASGSDRDVLSYATGERRAILTHNRHDFFRLHRFTLRHGGIISCTRDSDSLALANRVHSAILAAGTLDNVYLRVNRPAVP